MFSPRHTASTARSKGLWLPRRNLPLMDRVARCRRAARDAVADVEPSRLQAVIAETIDDASMTPAVLTVESAVAADPDADRDAVARRAAGVQLIYEGLRLTRTLARDEPWADSPDHTDANLGVLAADVLVSRGFYLLAMTDAAEKAVETIRAFGRDQTHRREPGADREALDANLERHVFELACVTGASAVEASVPQAVQEAVDRLAREVEDPLPDAESLFDGTALVPNADGPAPPSPTDP